MLMHAAVNNTKDIVPSAVPLFQPFAMSTSPGLTNGYTSLDFCNLLPHSNEDDGSLASICESLRQFW
jgi:hypothetical protein